MRRLEIDHCDIRYSLGETGRHRSGCWRSFRPKSAYVRLYRAQCESLSVTNRVRSWEFKTEYYGMPRLMVLTADLQRCTSQQQFQDGVHPTKRMHRSSLASIAPSADWRAV